MSDYIPAFDLNVPLEEDDDGNLPFDLNAPLPEDDNNNGKQQCFFKLLCLLHVTRPAEWPVLFFRKSMAMCLPFLI